MSDSEDADFCVESWTLPQKSKGQNERKKDKKDQKRKNSGALKTHESAKKKKKSPKLSETVVERKEKTKEKRKGKKKGKKKKKKKLEPDDDDVTLTHGRSAQAKLIETPAAADSFQDKKPNPDDPSRGSKTKRKKMVAFGLSPGCIRVKRPQFACSSPKEMKAASQDESCSQVTATGQPHYNDSECTSDDINSQDLFITQKRFRASPSEPSSSEATDRAAAASPQVLTQRNKGQRTHAPIKPPQNSYSHQHHGASHEREPETEERNIYEPRRREKRSFQTQVEFKESIVEKKVSVCARDKAANPFLDVPVVINPTQDAASSRCSTSCLPLADEPPLLAPHSSSTSTQTENFFTSELSSYLSFCRGGRGTLHSDHWKPLDLSLPQRARKYLRLSVKGEDRGAGTSGSPQEKEVKRNPSESTPSPQSEADLKSADTTTSSEDDHSCRTGKRDPIQVKGVQMKLNKPFFFKTKGEGSPRPESPLMKLSQGRDTKTKKHHYGRQGRI